METNEYVTIMVRVPKKLHREFKADCAKRDVRMVEEVVAMLEARYDTKEDTPLAESKRAPFPNEIRRDAS